MKDYANNEIKVNGCYGCAYANHEFSIPCGMVYENEYLTISQDWELPINGWIVLCPKHHVEKLEDLTDKERNVLFEHVNLTTKYLKELGVSEYFSVEMEERKNVHFHISVIPKHEWMKEVAGSWMDNIGAFTEYAKTNLRTKQNLQNIENTVKKLSNLFKENKNS